MCASAVTDVDDAEAIPVRVGKHYEIGVRRIRVPLHSGGAEADKSLGLSGLFFGVVDDEVKMDPRMFLGRRIRALQRHSRPLTGWRYEDREFVAGVGEANRPVPENL